MYETQIWVRVDPDLKKHLGHLAVDRGVTISDLVREALEQIFFAESVQSDAHSEKTLNGQPTAAV